jgi:hypothetical protein
MSLLVMLHSVADGLRTILFITDFFRSLMRNFVRACRNVSSFNFCQSSPSQSNGRDVAARSAAQHSNWFARYQPTQTGNSFRPFPFAGA